jgi:hypothetical protein
MLAVWHYLESASAKDEADPAELKSRIAHAHEGFVTGAYAVAFELVPRLLLHGEEITTQSEVRYMVTPAGGGLLIQKMNLEPDNPGIVLDPDSASTENWLQLMIDLPELIGILGAT